MANEEISDAHWKCLDALTEATDLNDWLKARNAELEKRIVELVEERELWKDRWQAERADHEATMKAFDKMQNDDPLV